MYLHQYSGILSVYIASKYCHRLDHAGFTFTDNLDFEVIWLAEARSNRSFPYGFIVSIAIILSYVSNNSVGVLSLLVCGLQSSSNKMH